MDLSRHSDESRGPGIPRDAGLRKLDSGRSRNDGVLASLVGEPEWTQRILASANPWIPAYYVLKLDHPVAVPALICLFLGIARIYKDAVSQESRTDG